MTTDESNTEQRRLDDRVEVIGEIDFTMMYAAHDAFSRDLERLLLACRGGNAWDAPEDAPEHARWDTFTTQLHIHHHAEDEALWPRLRAATQNAQEIATLDAMEREHAEIDPHLAEVGHAIAADNPPELAATLQRLSDGLTAHMRHEENAALPMIANRLGPAGWKAFTDTFRETQGIRGAALYFPWLLEDAPERIRTKVLGVLPPPARLLYRTVWAPRYRRGQK